MHGLAGAQGEGYWQKAMDEGLPVGVAEGGGVVFTRPVYFIMIFSYQKKQGDVNMTLPPVTRSSAAAARRASVNAGGSTSGSGTTSHGL